MNQVFMWSGYALLIIASVTGIFRRPTAFIGLIAAVVLFMAANIDRVSSFEVSPSSVKADLKEISTKVEDAKATLNQIQDLAVANAKIMIYMREDSKGIIFDSSVDSAVSDDFFKKKILDSLKKMGLPDSKIEEVEQSDRDIVLRNYSYFIFRHALAQLPINQQNKFEKDYSELEAKTAEGPITTEDLQTLLDRYQIDQSKFEEYIDDYKYYQKNTAQRRPEVWAQRSKWGYPDNANSK